MRDAGPLAKEVAPVYKLDFEKTTGNVKMRSRGVGIDRMYGSEYLLGSESHTLSTFPKEVLNGGEREDGMLVVSDVAIYGEAQFAIISFSLHNQFGDKRRHPETACRSWKMIK